MKSGFVRALPVAILLVFQAIAHAGVLEAHQGHWLGDMKIPDGRILKIGAEVFTRADGSVWASVASPDQGQYAMILKRVNDDGATAELVLSFASLTLTWEKDHFNGLWKQGRGVFPLELKQVAAFPRKERPQTPRAPFPYHDEALAIASTDKVMLGATLSIPDGKTRPKVVVLVHGSGPSTRDTDIEGHQPFVVLADYLARQGIAVLRYDKRGNARSTGDYEQLTSAKLADDLQAVVRTLKARKDFSRVGLIGLSEGSGIAAAVAARDPEAVDFVVSLAGIGLSGLDTLLLQDRISAMDAGASPEEADRLVAYVSNYYHAVIAHEVAEPRLAALKALQSALSVSDQALIVKYKMNQGSLRLAEAKSPWLRTVLLSDPRTDWQAVRGSALILNGSLDHQVPAQESLGGIVAALRKGGNTKVESAILPSLNHLFQTAKSGTVEEYASIDETMAPSVMQRVAAFVNKQR